MVPPDPIRTATISVVIPCFNRAATLERAVSSVVRQTRPPLEIIIVDDGSDDGTRELIRQRFPQCIYLRQENLGVSRARNRGISAARGDWIALLDSDDEWLPSKLEHQLSLLASLPDCRICHTDEIWIRHGRRVNPKKKHAKQGGELFFRCLPLCAISPSSVLLHRSLIEEVGGFDESFPACEDYDLWLRICVDNAVAFVETPQVIKYGGHPDQLSRTVWGLDRYRIRALEKIITSGRLSKAYRAAAVQTLIQKAGIVANGAKKRGNEALAKQYQDKITSMERFHAE